MTHADIPVEKYHGTGNDFVVVDAAANDVPDRAAFARAHCDRLTGVAHPESDVVGADGVLFLARDADNPARVVMRLFQPDGSTAAMCGNGARVAATWVAARDDATDVELDTPAGVRRATVHADGVTVEMGVPSFDPAAVPVARDDPLVAEPVAGLPVTAVDTGVPHAVSFLEDIPAEHVDAEASADALDAVDLDALAPPVRHADVFPEGANVTLAAPNSDGFRQRTFERGVESETQSCGTGAVAIAAVARRRGLVGDDPVRVSPPGGALEVTVPAEGPATLRGPVVREYATTLRVPDTA